MLSAGRMLATQYERTTLQYWSSWMDQPRDLTDLRIVASRAHRMVEAERALHAWIEANGQVETDRGVYAVEHGRLVFAGDVPSLRRVDDDEAKGEEMAVPGTEKRPLVPPPLRIWRDDPDPTEEACQRPKRRAIRRLGEPVRCAGIGPDRSPHGRGGGT